MSKVWIVSAGRAGDLGQLQLVAEALGWSYEIKALSFRRVHPAKIALWPESYLDSPSPFSGVMPEIVLCAEAAACALAAKAKRRGLAFKLVCIGRPRGHYRDFDLIITSPQYELPDADNVVELPVAPHRRVVLDEIDHQFVRQYQSLARPIDVVLVGGTSRPDILDGPAATLLAHAINRRAAETNGSTVVVTSPRTGDVAASMLKVTLKEGIHFVAWSKDNNPYKALLTVADRFLVTSDTVSMTVEAMLTGQRVAIHTLPQSRNWGDRLVDYLSRIDVLTFLFDAGLLETRPRRARLFRSLSHRFGLSFENVEPWPGDQLPETAQHTAALIRSLTAAKS